MSMTTHPEFPTEPREQSSSRSERINSHTEKNELSYDQRADAAAEAVRQVVAHLEGSTN